MHYERVSLARRGGSWRMSYRAVYDAEHKGDRKWATIGAAASRAEAEHLAAEYLYNLPRDPEDERRAEAIEATEGRMPTVGELRRDDIDHALAVGAIEKSTHAGYCRHVRLLGDLGEIPVDRVTAQDVQLYVDSLVEDGYCSETVNHMLWTVRDTLELASFRMLRPPLDLRRIRAPKHDRPLPRALSAEEKNALLAALPCIRGPLDAIVRLALFAGLRCGEICALRWANVDFNRRTVRITSAIGTLPSSNGYLKGPKSPAGVRALPIADGLMEGLERRRAEQEARCREAGIPFADGSTDFLHLAPGTYRVAESEAPAGYVEAPEIKTFTVGADGRIEGREAGQASFEDDFTKVRISKRDITDESEVEGAKLTVTDSEGKTVDSWTSTAEDHEIDALAPGKYTLTEERTPTAYDQAESIEFEVKKTGEVQTVTMYDSPISISGEIDKRQEIADPTVKDTEANGDGQNTAETKASNDGSYAYTIDFRSTSNTWTDEFTVEDDLTAATDGRAQLTSITTPQALEDYDGKMNVWYKTDKTPEDYVDESGANATLSDGHENPWLSDEATAATLGEDGRAVDFTGWKLWCADVPTTEATELSVADLGLEDDEHVTAIRFEYGRVESGFTTRDGGWDRDGIKDVHDDIASAEDTAKENGSRPDSSGDKAETALAPAIVHMKATDGYTAGRALDNYARVDLFRNGGGDGLEGHDEDQVTQTAKAVTVPPTNLDQTGRNVIIGLAAALAVAAAAAAALIYRRRTRGSAADDDEPDDDGYDREDYGHEDRYGDGCDRDDYGYDDRYRDEIRDRY